MSLLLYSGISFVVMIVSIVVMFVLLGKYNVNVKEEDCVQDNSTVKKKCKSEDNCCVVWDKSSCRIGDLQSDGETCYSKGHVGPLVLFILSGVSLLVSIVLLVMYFIKKKK